MRLDHIAYRVKDRIKTAEFFQKAFGYKIQTEFELDFGDKDDKVDKVKCLALEPPEKMDLPASKLPWVCNSVIYDERAPQGEDYCTSHTKEYLQEYHLPPEIFVSDGSLQTIVGKWVEKRGGIGGIHHLAYQVDDVKKKMEEWKQMGYAEFTSDEPFQCPGLVQVFTKPSLLTGVIYEFIKREEYGFCAGNVKQLMASTANADIKMG